MRWLLVLTLSIAACGKSSAPERARPERAIDAAPSPDAAPPADADAAAAPDAATPAPPPDAAVKVGPQDQVRGIGACKTDGDCVLSYYQQGCCTQACQSYAISLQVLAAHNAKEDCAAFRASGTLCQPPAPCPVPTHRSVGARCVRGACYTVREKLMP